MLYFIGLGLYDHKDVSVRGLECIRGSDCVFLEGYTSHLAGTSHEEMESFFNTPISVLEREDVEQNPDLILDAAEKGIVAFLTGGDPMVSTTHADLRIRAKERGIKTAIIHGASISSAVCGLTGLQNYRFGKSCSLPFPAKNWSPTTPIEVIGKNLDAGLHTLVYLDIQKDRCMTVPFAIGLLEQMAEKAGIKIPLYVGVARAGSSDPVVSAGPAQKVRNTEFGPPLHILVIPGPLHVMEEEYLSLFGGL